MNLQIGKLTTKYQATIPKAIREVLHLSAHDQIVYEVTEDNAVMIRKASPLDVEYYKALKHTLNEWESEEDEKAYKNL